MYRNRHQYTYVMPYGRLPMKGGNVYLQTGKTLAKEGFVMAKKLWSRLSPEQKKQKSSPNPPHIHLNRLTNSL